MNYLKIKTFSWASLANPDFSALYWWVGLPDIWQTILDLWNNNIEDSVKILKKSWNDFQFLRISKEREMNYFYYWFDKIKIKRRDLKVVILQFIIYT